MLGDANDPSRAHRVDPRNIEVIDDVTAAAIRAIPGRDRVAMLDEFYEFAFGMTMCKVRELHPAWTDAEIHSETVRRMLRAHAQQARG